MEEKPFLLSNEQRRYLGLMPVAPHWELVPLNDMFLYFDGDIIRKRITSDETGYVEQELCERTAEERRMLLPKTEKGKPKKLNYTATQSFSPFGVYFSFRKDDYVSISNYSTQTTYFSENAEEGDLSHLLNWLENWIKESSDTDLKEIEHFKTATRKHHKYKEGDFFAFKFSRRQWGFGRILMDVAKLRKTEDFKKQKNYGLTHFMGKALIVKVYHKISDGLDVNLDELASTLALPSEAVMDNHFYYGQNIIIGHQPLKINELDMLISYSRSISGQDKDTVYLQYGLIYLETEISKFNKYLSEKGKGSYDHDNPYRNESIGYGLTDTHLERCIREKSNDSYWDPNHYTLRHDLRNPANQEIKKEIFSAFGLNADLDYIGNLNL